ncbi:NUDIX domain-containing protein [Halostreptopolyspora alba]|uniref:NUDIX hydrolase n=1 Tax=Halostreptopolyspora alba TaxID=2487137 RepID=A0A3N0EFF5_9ACTN|nr:NUDIX hydrolase [Nocardiopsaceae bacterium YIM 96095]
MSGEDPEPLADTPESWPVEHSAERFRGAKSGMRTDWVRMPGAEGPEVVRRDFLEHPGAVGTLALDEAGRVLLIRQYRHAVAHRLWELPAGVRDQDGEPPVRTAQRELLEEAGYRAERWHALADFFPSAGFSTERIQVFLARGLTEVPQAEIDFEWVHEEADLPIAWLSLEDAAAAVMEGRLRNSVTVVGVLAALHAARDGFASLRRVE